MSQVGARRHMATIEQMVKGQDAAGGKTETWQTHAQLWVAIVPLSGRERYYSHERHAEATHQITGRYIAGVEPKMRITARGRTFEIVSALNVGERDKSLIIIATEEVDHDR